MIKETLKIFSQNVRKNKALTNIILENNKNTMDVIFIQEPLYGTPNHPEQTLYIRQDVAQDNYARVTTYVSKCLSKLRFALCLDIVNHCNINVLFFYNEQDVNFMINVYSDSNQTTLQFLNQNIVNLNNTIIMTGNFNIRDSDWDPNFHHHSIHTNNFFILADSLGLEFSSPTNPGPTRFTDNPQDSNSVIDLVFLPPNNPGFGCHLLHPEIQKPSDHVPLTIKIGIKEINIDINIWTIGKDSKEEENFINSITNGIMILDTANINSKETLENTVQHIFTICKGDQSGTLQEIPQRIG